MTPGLRDSPRCRARKALPLDQMDMMSELGHSRGEGAAGRSRADDADISHGPFPAGRAPRYPARTTV